MSHVDVDTDAIVAIAELVPRTGGTKFEIGYRNDETDASFWIDGPCWYAQALYKGFRLMVDHGYRRPEEAADALARRILDGGRCTHCNHIVALRSNAGDEFCRWRRMGDRWVRGCEEK